jgi:hypothetical protein
MLILFLQTGEPRDTCLCYCIFWKDAAKRHTACFPDIRWMCIAVNALYEKYNCDDGLIYELVQGILVYRKILHKIYHM